MRMCDLYIETNGSVAGYWFTGDLDAHVNEPLDIEFLYFVTLPTKWLLQNFFLVWHLYVKCLLKISHTWVTFLSFEQHVLHHHWTSTPLESSSSTFLLLERRKNLKRRGTFCRVEIQRQCNNMFLFWYLSTQLLTFELTINFSCRIPECENENCTSLPYLPKWIDKAIPFHDGEPYKCRRFKPSRNFSILVKNADVCLAEFNESVIEECDDWVFETEEKTIVNSVCSFWKLSPKNNYCFKVALSSKILTSSIFKYFKRCKQLVNFWTGGATYLKISLLSSTLRLTLTIYTFTWTEHFY